ncbi:hypothetical protein HRbin26_02323 [bacterium HR26]|nr:hypothetical protein HRbin26_02323 [bacterium HR26]
MERQKQPGTVASPEESAGTAGEGHPYGTLFLLLVYLIVVIAIWGTVYLTMLERG